MNDRNEYLSILLDIKEDVGALNAKMIEAFHSRVRIEESQKEMVKDIQELKPIAEVVTQMKPEHDELVKFKDRIGGYIWFAGAIAAGAVYLLWQGLLFFGDKIKAAIFH